MNIDQKDFLRLSATQHRRTVTIETPFLGATASQVLDELELLVLAMGYTEMEWRDAICSAALLFADSSEKTETREAE